MSTLKDQIEYCKGCLDRGGIDTVKMREILVSLELIDKLNLIPPTVEGSDYQRFVEMYWKFRTERGASPKMSPAAGRALKEIIVYFLRNDKIDGDINKALEAWEYVLSRWNDLTDYIRQQVGLPAINKHIEEILEQLRNGTRKGQQQANKNAKDELANLIKRRRGGE